MIGVTKGDDSVAGAPLEGDSQPAALPNAAHDAGNVWPPPPDESTGWYTARFNHDGIDGTWVLRGARLWGRSVLIDEQGRPLCWSCMELQELPRRLVDVVAFLRLHSFPRPGPPNAGTGPSPRPLSGQPPAAATKAGQAAPAAHRYSSDGFSPGLLPEVPQW